MGLKLVKYGTFIALILLAALVLFPRRGLHELSKSPGIDLGPTSYWVDPGSDIAFDELPPIDSFYTTTEVELHPKADVTNAYWLYVQLDSTQQKQIVASKTASYLYFGVHDDIEVYSTGHGSQKGGLFYKERRPAAFKFYFPIDAEKENQEYWVRIKDHFWIKDTINVEVFTEAQKEQNTEYVYQLSNHQYTLFSVALMSVLAYAILFFLMQFIQVRELAFLFYSIYLICVLLYVLRGFEYRTEYFVLFSYAPGSVIYLEPMILFLMHGFYAPFIYFFLDLPKQSPHLKKIFDTFFYVVIGTFIVSNVMMVVLNFNGLASQLYIYIFMALVISVVVIITYTLIRLKSQLTIFVWVGITFLCMSVIANTFVFEKYCHGTYPEKFWQLPQVYPMIGVLLELLCFSFGLGYKNKLAAKEKNQLQTQQAQSEQKALSAQLNSHMLFNCLNSIRELITQNKNDEAEEYLVKFSVFIRGVLETSERRNSTLEKELEVSDAYLALEALSFDDSFHYAIEVDEAVDTSFINLPPLILQPYIENALIHGLASKEGEKHLRIIVKDAGDQVKCIIDDNGVGIKEKTSIGPTLASPKQSLGRKLSEERITVFNKIYDTQISVQTIKKTDDQNRSTGTRIEFTIDY